MPRIPEETIDHLFTLPDAELLTWVLGIYREQMGDEKLQEFLRSRGLIHPSLIDQFQLGYSVGTLGPLLPAKAGSHGAALRGRLERLGILDASGGETLAGRLIVPLWTAGHGLGQLCGYSIASGPRAGAPEPLYLEGPRSSCLFHPGVVEQCADLILCETPIDALAYWSNGLRNVTAACGASGFPEALFESMKRQSTRRVLVAYAHDAAGDQGAQKVAERLLGAGIECYRVAFSEGLGVGELAARSETAAEALREGLRQVTPMSSGRLSEEAEEAAGKEKLLSSPAAPAIGPRACCEGRELVLTLGDRRFRLLLQLEELAAEPLGEAR